jgi:tellurite methyltransferase
MDTGRSIQGAEEGRMHRPGLRLWRRDALVSRATAIDRLTLEEKVMAQQILKPASLLGAYWPLFQKAARLGPIIDLACGRGRNGLFLATQGIPVVLIDHSSERLAEARRLARQAGVMVDIRRIDLENAGADPLEGLAAGGMMVFRYLHRPLVAAIRRSIRTGGILMYETFTHHQRRLGRPRSPDYLLQPQELKGWFRDWQILHYFEGLKEEPLRALAQIVCRKTDSRA